MEIFNARTTNGATGSLPNHSYLQSVYCWGNFDGATVSLEASPDGTEWFSVLSFTQKGIKGMGIKARFLRGSVSSAGAATNVNLLVE